MIRFNPPVLVCRDTFSLTSVPHFTNTTVSGWFEDRSYSFKESTFFTGFSDIGHLCQMLPTIIYKERKPGMCILELTFNQEMSADNAYNIEGLLHLNPHYLYLRFCYDVLCARIGITKPTFSFTIGASEIYIPPDRRFILASFWGKKRIKNMSCWWPVFEPMTPKT